MQSTTKLAITLWNFKGGVGKSTISLIISEIAAQSGLRVLAIDLDEQRNLAHTLSLASSSLPSLEIRTSLAPEFATEDFDLFVLDTHPAKDEYIISALNFADIVLIPVLGDFYSIINLRSVYDYAISAGVGSGQIAIVKNCMSNVKVSTEIENVLDEQGYSSAGRLPRSNILIRNIASGNHWDKFMQTKQREPFLNFYSNIWSAYREMIKGNFHNLWRT